jgi:hypothetical protein
MLGRLEMMPRRPLLDHARLYAGLGLRVFPCARLVRNDDAGRLQCSCPRGAECENPGKHPRESGWREAEPELTRWWGLGGLWNIGIVTGAPSNIVVLDIDPRNAGDETLRQLENRYGDLPGTWRFLTGGGGEHIVFQHPGGYVKSRPGALGRGLDVKADGGLIIAPPSLHMSGRRYAISVDHPIHPYRSSYSGLAALRHSTIARRLGRRRRSCPGHSRTSPFGMAAPTLA